MDDMQVRARLIELVNEMPVDQQRDLIKLLEWGRKDQRKHVRKSCKRPAVLTARDSRYEGVAKNISEEGIFIETPAKVTVGQEVSLVFPLFSFEDPVTISGRVVRAEPLGIAVKFDALFQDFFNKTSKRGSGETG